jgi:KUP system potassium uptake protein
VGLGLLWLVVAVFFAATLPKLPTGGWLPTSIGLVVFAVMSTWWSGRRRLAARTREDELTAEQLAQEVAAWGGNGHRVPGDAVFLTHERSVAPLALDMLVHVTRLMPRRVVLLSWHVEDTPRAPAREESVEVEQVGDDPIGLHAVDVTLGYRERLDVRQVLRDAAAQSPDGLAGLDPEAALYVVSDPIPRLGHGTGMARWRQRVFLVLDRLSSDRIEELALPSDRTVTVARELPL